MSQSDDKTAQSAYNPEVPGDQVRDDSYKTKQNENIPVVGDNDLAEDPIQADIADSDRQLDQDDKEAIDKSNIIQERTRHAQPEGSYEEPSESQFIVSENE